MLRCDLCDEIIDVGDEYYDLDSTIWCIHCAKSGALTGHDVLVEMGVMPTIYGERSEDT